MKSIKPVVLICALNMTMEIAVANDVKMGGLPMVGNTITINFINRTPYSIVLSPSSNYNSSNIIFTTSGTSADPFLPPIIALNPASENCTLGSDFHPTCTVNQTNFLMNAALVSGLHDDEFNTTANVRDRDLRRLSGGISSIFQSNSTFPRSGHVYQGIIDGLNSLQYKMLVVSNDPNVSKLVSTINSQNPEIKFTSKYALKNENDQVPDPEKPKFAVLSGISNSVAALAGIAWGVSVHNPRFLSPTEDREGKAYKDYFKYYLGNERYAIDDFLKNENITLGTRNIIEKDLKKRGFIIDDKKIVRRKSSRNYLHLVAGYSSAIPGFIGLGLQMGSYFSQLAEYNRLNSPAYQEGTKYSLFSPGDNSYPIYAGLEAMNSSSSDSANIAQYTFSGVDSTGNSVYKSIFTKAYFDKSSGALYVVIDSTKNSPAGNENYDVKSIADLPGLERTLNIHIKPLLADNNEDQTKPEVKLSFYLSGNTNFKYDIEDINFPFIDVHGVNINDKKILNNCHMEEGVKACDIYISHNLLQQLLNNYYCLAQSNKEYKKSLLEILYHDDKPSDASSNPPFFTSVDLEIDPKLLHANPQTMDHTQCESLLSKNYEATSGDE